MNKIAGKISSKKSVTAVGLTGALLSGAGTYLYSFFTNAYPAIEKKVVVLETRSEIIQESQKEIKNELRQLRVGQKEIYYLILKDKK